MATPVKARRLKAEPVPVRAARLGPRDVVSERRPDGTIRLTSPDALASYPAKLTARLQYWAAAAPERTFLAQRPASGWRKMSYHGPPPPGRAPPPELALLAMSPQ